ncbi:MAG: hypothetical protein HY737_00490 [Candidatus Omnitrophica bacterium]|nr:hypothetical protein [Candidatus Omnitrophota bacterium]
MAVAKFTKFTVEEFIKSRLRDVATMRQAARHMDALRKRCGKPEPGFESVAVLRKIREAR